MSGIELLHQKWPRLRFTTAFLKYFLRILSLTAPAWGMILGLIGLLGFMLALKEKISIADAFYCTCITAMTVGYGDITPVTHLGRIYAVMIGILGIIATGIIVAAAIQAVKLAYDQTISPVSQEEEGKPSKPIL